MNNLTNGTHTHYAALGIGTFLSGFMTSMGLITAPLILQTATTSSTLLHQFRVFFWRGHWHAAPTVFSTSVLYVLTAGLKYRAGEAWQMFFAAGVCTFGAAIFTLNVMAPVNDRLLGWEKEKKAEVGLDEVKALFKKWTSLHLVRCVFPLVGAVIGAYALRGESMIVNGKLE